MKLPKLKREYATVELADGRILEVRVINPDIIRYQQTAQKHGWPQMKVSGTDKSALMPHLDYEDTFKAWAALRRTGQYDGTWEQFLEHDCIQVAVESDEDAEDVDPTQPAPASDSVPSSPGSDAEASTS